MTRILGRYEWRSREVSAGPKAAKKLGSSGNCVVNDRRMMQARALHFSPSSRRLLPYNLIRMCRPTPVQRDHGHHVDGSGVSEAAPVGNHNLIRSAVIGRFRVIRVAAPGRQPFTRRRRQRKGERLAFTADDAGQCGFSTRPRPRILLASPWPFHLDRADRGDRPTGRAEGGHNSGFRAGGRLGTAKSACGPTRVSGVLDSDYPAGSPRPISSAGCRARECHPRPLSSVRGA